MKRLRLDTVLLVGMTVAVIGLAVWYIVAGDSPKAVTESRELRSRRIVDAKSDRKIRKDKPLDRRAKDAKKIVERPVPVKPDFLADLEDDKKLTAEMKKMFLDLQAALDLDNAKKVYALVHKLQLMDEWPDGIPKSVKMKALQALSWFGAAGMAEAVGFLADSDPEIRQESLDKFNEMLSDWDLGDTGISAIIKEIVKVVHDRDALDSFFMELNNMRPTVRAETALSIFDSKNPDAIAVLKDNMDFIFDSGTEVKNREDIESYLADARQVYEDDPEKAAEDEDYYGPPRK